MLKSLKLTLVLAVILAAVFIFREPLQGFWGLFQKQYFPCQQPIAYSLGEFDREFSLSPEDFLSAVKEAEEIWEKPLDLELFQYSPAGELKINLIYDYRQEATLKLAEMGLGLKDTQASYDQLKTKYEAIYAEYNILKSQFEAKREVFLKRQQAYEAEVIYWNEKGGADEPNFQKLTKEKKELDYSAQALNQMQDELNKKVEELNALAVGLNKLVASLKLNVSQFNQIGRERGGEFEEGNYESGPEGEKISIYQFDNRIKLVRVLTHELGHALGLEHNENPEAIMYRLNNGVNDKLTDDDLKALKNQCGLE